MQLPTYSKISNDRIVAIFVPRKGYFTAFIFHSCYSKNTVVHFLQVLNLINYVSDGSHLICRPSWTSCDRSDGTPRSADTTTTSSRWSNTNCRQKRSSSSQGTTQAVQGTFSGFTEPSNSSWCSWSRSTSWRMKTSVSPALKSLTRLDIWEKSLKKTTDFQLNFPRGFV